MGTFFLYLLQIYTYIKKREPVKQPSQHLLLADKAKIYGIIIELMIVWKVLVRLSIMFILNECP